MSGFSDLKWFFGVFCVGYLCFCCFVVGFCVVLGVVGCIEELKYVVFDCYCIFEWYFVGKV